MSISALVHIDVCRFNNSLMRTSQKFHAQAFWLRNFHISYKYQLRIRNTRIGQPCNCCNIWIWDVFYDKIRIYHINYMVLECDPLSIHWCVGELILIWVFLYVWCNSKLWTLLQIQCLNMLLCDIGNSDITH